MTTLQIMQKVKAASKSLSLSSTQQKNAALLAMADALEADASLILAENEKDLVRCAGIISPVMQDRLRLNEKRIAAMAEGMRDVAALDDPVGKLLQRYHRPDGLLIEKVSVPLGVVAIIYESRPNVTSDAAALAVKSGNACILRCGKEAHSSAAAITSALRKGLALAGLNQDLVMLVEDTSRESAMELMRGNDYIDLLIPRGGKGLIDSCVQNATVPCIATGTGICHIYVDKAADLEKALSIIENAKTSRPSVCNAAEVCLIDRPLLPVFVPMLQKHLTERSVPVTLKMDEACRAFAPEAVPAGPDDFDTEFLDYILAVGAVDGVEGAIRHIEAHSTHHSEAIITESENAAVFFCRSIDSAAVYVNASTRFTDGGEFGLGCEMGISTQKLHARGPMGLQELTTYKYIIHGNGHIR